MSYEAFPISQAKSIEEAAEFWDNQDTADIWDQTHEVRMTFARRGAVAVAENRAPVLRVVARDQKATGEVQRRDST